MGMMARSKMLQELNEEKDWELPTSMIDVVFLLLIFFLCATKFRTIEKRLDAYLPKDKGPHQQVEVVKQLDEITLHVTGKGEALRVPEFQIVNWVSNNPNELASFLKQMSQVGDRPVVIDGRPNCPFRHIMTALDCCARANLTKVEFRPPPAVDGGGDDRHYRKL